MMDWSMLQASPNRESIQAARARLLANTQLSSQLLYTASHNDDARASCYETSTDTFVFTDRDVAFPIRDGLPVRMRFFLKLDHLQEKRGIVLAMESLIDRVGIEDLQLRGVSTQAIGQFTENLARVAKIYDIPVFDHMSHSGLSSQQEKVHDQRSDIGRPNGGGGTSVHARAPIEPVVFPKPASNVVLNGEGTIALELEEEIASLREHIHSEDDNGQRKLDAVICDVSTGVALGGICGALAGSGTWVIGVQPKSDERWLFCDRCKKNTRFELHTICDNCIDCEEPMSDALWSIFTSRGLLATVMDASQDALEEASHFAFAQHHITLSYDAVAPIALGLYTEDFEDLVQKLVKERENDRVFNIGLIVQAPESSIDSWSP